MRGLRVELVVVCLCLALVTGSATTSTNGVHRVLLNAPRPKKYVNKPVPSEAASPFFKEVRRQKAYAQARLGARFAQLVNFTVGNYAFVEREMVTRANITAATLAGDELKLEDFTTRVLHAPESTGKIVLHSRLQIDGQVLFAAQNLDETLHNIQAHLDSTESSLFSPAASRSADPARAPLQETTAFIESLSVPSHGPGHGSAPLSQRQWRQVHHDHFSVSATGWHWNDDGSSVGVMHCGNGDLFLEARCSKQRRSLSLSKTYALPPHDRLYLVAKAHFIDQWMSSTAFAMVDGQYVWVETNHDGNSDIPHATNICGDAWPHDRLSEPIHVVVPHTGSFVNITFGTNELPASEACAALGIDDVALFV